MQHISSRILRDQKVKRFLISHSTNIRYLTGAEVSFGRLVIAPGKMTLFVDARYTEEVKKSVNKGVSITSIAELSKEIGRTKQCLFEGDHVTVLQLKRWKKHFSNTRLLPAAGLVEELRRQKTTEEIRTMKKAERITKDILTRIPGALRSKPTERELAWKLRVWTHELGADEFSFDPIVAFGKHTSHPHHHLTALRLKKGDIVQIDMGVRVDGYCSDLSRVFFTKRKTTEQERVHGVLMRAHDNAVQAALSGRTNHELDRIARALLAQEGIEQAFTHALGHGVGLDVHEGITISSHAPKQKLLQNEVIAIEPGVYFPGKWGMRIESMVYVK